MRSNETHSPFSMTVFKNLPEGMLAELIDGEIFLFQSPKMEHQRLSGKILQWIGNMVEDDKKHSEVLMRPLDVYLDEEGNVVQPDILWISAENRSITREDAIHGSPTMIIELLSPENTFHDLVRKRALYERFQISEYHIVSPQTKETISFTLKDGRYVESKHEIGKLHSVALGHQTFEF